METSPWCNSVAGHQIATNVCTCHDSTAVVPCTAFCSDHCIRIEMRVKRNFHRIWIAMEKPLVKRDPGYFHSSLLKMKIFVLDKLILSPLVWQVGLVQGGGGANLTTENKSYGSPALQTSGGLLPDTYAGCACAGNVGNVFPDIAGLWSRHVSRHGLWNQLFPVLSHSTGGHRTRVAAVANMAEDAVAASASLRQILTVSVRYCGPAFMSWLSMLWETLTWNPELQWSGISPQFRLKVSRGDEGVGDVCFPVDEGVGRPWRGYRCVQRNVGPA